MADILHVLGFALFNVAVWTWQITTRDTASLEARRAVVVLSIFTNAAFIAYSVAVLWGWQGI